MFDIKKSFLFSVICSYIFTFVSLILFLLSFFFLEEYRPFFLVGLGVSMIYLTFSNLVFGFDNHMESIKSVVFRNNSLLGEIKEQLAKQNVEIKELAKQIKRERKRRGNGESPKDKQLNQLKKTAEAAAVTKAKATAEAKAVIEAAIREKLKKPTGELTKGIWRR